MTRWLVLACFYKRAQLVGEVAAAPNDSKRALVGVWMALVLKRYWSLTMKRRTGTCHTSCINDATASSGNSELACVVVETDDSRLAFASVLGICKSL